jgi:hypothetical protein
MMVVVVEVVSAQRREVVDDTWAGLTGNTVCSSTDMFAELRARMTGARQAFFNQSLLMCSR